MCAVQTYFLILFLSNGRLQFFRSTLQGSWNMHIVGYVQRKGYITGSRCTCRRLTWLIVFMCSICDGDVHTSMRTCVLPQTCLLDSLIFAVPISHRSQKYITSAEFVHNDAFELSLSSPACRQSHLESLYSRYLPTRANSALVWVSNDEPIWMMTHQIYEYWASK